MNKLGGGKAQPLFAFVKCDTRLISAVSTAMSAVFQESMGGGARGPVISANRGATEDARWAFDVEVLSTMFIRDRNYYIEPLTRFHLFRCFSFARSNCTHRRRRGS